VSTAIVVVAVAIAYIALGGVSWIVVCTPNDAWTEWDVEREDATRAWRR
jgi:hypothetical protein